MPQHTVVVAGGGTVGVIAAVSLARQGWNVQVFEKTSPPAAQPSHGDPRAYYQSLTSRGIRAFKLAGVSLNPLVAAQGDRIAITFFKKNGAKLREERVPVTANPIHLRLSREELNSHAVKEAQRLHPNIKFHFNSPIEHVDLARQVIQVASPDSAQHVEVPYDLLIGADGVNSVVRSALQQILPSTFLRRYKHAHVYTSAAIPSDPSKTGPKFTMLEAHALQKEGTIARDVRRSDRNQLGLILPKQKADAISAGDAEDFLGMLKASAPHLPEDARKAAVELIQSRPEFYPLPHWTWLSQLHGPKTVLLGDAAHTMTPALGQGLNAGLEDVTVFVETLEQHQDNVDAALPAYNKARLPDIQAVLTINEVVATSDVGVASQDQDVAHRLWIKLHTLVLIVHMIARTLLHQVAPKHFNEPLLMPMAMGTQVLPYRSIIRAMYWDTLVLVGFLAAIIAYFICS